MLSYKMPFHVWPDPNGLGTFPSVGGCWRELRTMCRWVLVTAISNRKIIILQDGQFVNINLRNRSYFMETDRTWSSVGVLCRGWCQF